MERTAGFFLNLASLDGPCHPLCYRAVLSQEQNHHHKEPGFTAYKMKYVA